MYIHEYICIYIERDIFVFIYIFAVNELKASLMALYMWRSEFRKSNLRKCW